VRNKDVEIVYNIAAFIRETLIILILVYLGFLIYSNVTEAPFILDDGHNIVNNPNIRIENLSLEELGKAGFQSPSRNRPIANISFAINYYLHQYNVKGFRLVNILLHVLTGIFLYLFIRNTLQTPALKPRYGQHRWLPLFATFLWLVHPVQTQSVTYIVQRMNCLSSMFYIISLWFYVSGRQRVSKKKKLVRYVGCVLAGIMSLGSKEIAATLPFFIFLYEWYFFRQFDRAWLKRQLFPFISSLIFLAALTFFYMGSNPLETMLSSYQGPDFSLGQRLLTQSRVIFFYLGLILFPHPSRLNLDHHFLISSSLVEPLTTLLSILGVIVMLTVAILLARRERLLSFCLLWFLGNLVIESSMIALEVVFEHRLYLPSMMLILMMVILVERFMRPVLLRVAFLCGLTVILSFWTYERNLVWQDEVSLWSDSARKSPGKVRPNNNLAIALVEEGELEHAVDYFKKALQVRPFSATLHKNMGNLMMEMDRMEAAEHHYKWASRISPSNPELHYKLGEALMELKKYDQAIRSFSEALRIKPGYKRALWKLKISRRLKEKISSPILP
jgi:tetratricopeptide (TPR) repeat protein